MYSREHRTTKKSSNQAQTPVNNQLFPNPLIHQPKAEEAKPPQYSAAEIQAKINDDAWLNSGRIDGAVFSRQVERPKPRGIQLKLTIGQPGDKYEQQVDQVEKDVVQKMNAHETTEVVQKKCSKCDEKEKSTETDNLQNTPTTLAMNPNGVCIDEYKDLPKWRKRAAEALAEGGAALIQFCMDLGQLIEDCHGDLNRRLLDLLNDRDHLYETRYSRNLGENTYQGHQDKYESTARVIEELVDFLDRHCLRDYNVAIRYAEAAQKADIARRTPAPQQPERVNSNKFLEILRQIMWKLAIPTVLSTDITKALRSNNPAQQLRIIGLTEKQIRALLELVLP